MHYFWTRRRAFFVYRILFWPSYVSKCVFPSDEDDDKAMDGADIGRPRRSDGLPMVDGVDDLDAGQTSPPLECPSGYMPCPAPLLRPMIHHS